MTRGMLFWVLMILWLIIGWWSDYAPGQPYPFKRGIWSLLVFVLLAILGWTVFGAAVK